LSAVSRVRKAVAKAKIQETAPQAQVTVEPAATEATSWSVASAGRWSECGAKTIDVAPNASDEL
jgi:hypothetical protein